MPCQYKAVLPFVDPDPFVVLRSGHLEEALAAVRKDGEAAQASIAQLQQEKESLASNVAAEQQQLQQAQVRSGV
jgi:predicted  nucleic acid-binding Zn-ribbon protein